MDTIITLTPFELAWVQVAVCRILEASKWVKAEDDMVKTQLRIGMEVLLDFIPEIRPKEEGEKS